MTERNRNIQVDIPRDPSTGLLSRRRAIMLMLAGASAVVAGPGKAIEALAACAPVKPASPEEAFEKPCYEGVIENTFQLGSFVYRPTEGSDNGIFDPEDCILDTVVKGNFKVALATGQNFDLVTDQSGWAKDNTGKQTIRVITESGKPGIKVVTLPNGTGKLSSYYATDAVVTTFKKGPDSALIEHEKFAGLLPFYKEGADYNPDDCGRVWVLGLDIKNIPGNSLLGVKNNPQESPKTVHPLRKVN